MAVDCYLYLEDESGEQIKGECTDVVFKDYIEIFKFDFDAKNPVEAEKVLGDGAGPRSERTWLGNSETEMNKSLQQYLAANPQDTGWDSFTFKVDKIMDKSSPWLFHSYCQGASRTEQNPTFKSAKVYLLVGGMRHSSDAKPEEISFLVLEFQKLQVKNYILKYDDGEAEESLTFNFASYVMTYRKQQTGGDFAPPIQKGYDMVGLQELPAS